jgi:DNA-binding MarR family transcriptional regulator
MEKRAAAKKPMNNLDHQQLDDIIHSRIRLAAMVVLVSIEEADFTYIRDAIKTTDGNLSIHLRKLEEAGYVQVTKRFLSRKPQSTYRLTAKGRKAFSHYVELLEKLIKTK